MARRNFATVDALFTLACVVIFAGGALAQIGGPSQSAPPRGGPPVEQIATDLGIPADRVRNAFQKVGPPPLGEQQQPPSEAQMKSHAQALATAMDVPVDKLAPVLQKYRPAPPPSGGNRGSNPGANAGDRS